MQKVGSAPQKSKPFEVPRLFNVTYPGPAHFFCAFSIFRFAICKLSHPQHQHDCVASSSIFFRGINFELCGGACAIKINEIKSRWQWCSPFSHVPIVCNFLISCCFISCSFLVVLYFMTNVPAPKRVWGAIRILCDACGKQFATSDGFDKHRKNGYLIGTPCHVLDDGSTRTHLVSSERATMSTAMLKLKVHRRKHGSAWPLLLVTYVYLWAFWLLMSTYERKTGGVRKRPSRVLDQLCLSNLSNLYNL